MAFSPIALTIPQYEDHPNEFLKAFIQGTVTPLAMATDATGGTTLAKAELDSTGFPITAGSARFIPFIDGDYDLWLFPTAAEADANDTSNAIQFADNLNSDPSSGGAASLTYNQGGAGATNRTVQNRLQRFINPADFGSVGDGTTDDSATLQASIAAAEALSDASGTGVGGNPIVVYLEGKNYGLSSGLTINKPITFTGGSLTALSGFTGSFMLTLASGAEKSNLEYIYMDGGLDGSNNRFADLIDVNADRVSFHKVFGIHFPNFGLKVTSCQEGLFTHVIMKEWLFTEAGTTNTSLRTAVGIAVEDADSLFTNCVANQCNVPITISGGLNLFVGCHFYNGGMTDATVDALSMSLTATADNNTFNGCYFDNGIVQITGSFNHVFSGCHFQFTAAGNNTTFIETFTSAAGEKLDGLNAVGNSFNGLGVFLRKSVTGGGSYAALADQKYTWVGNQNDSGDIDDVDLKVGENFLYNRSSDEFVMTSAGDVLNMNLRKSIRIAADFDNNSGAAQSEIILATDGVDRYKIATAGGLIPQTDNSQVFGSPTERMNNMFSNRYTLIDGVAAPSTVTGHASLYVDTADGDLKIKFGDGTVKTIVTDT